MAPVFHSSYFHLEANILRTFDVISDIGILRHEDNLHAVIYPNSPVLNSGLRRWNR